MLQDHDARVNSWVRDGSGQERTNEPAERLRIGLPLAEILLEGVDLGQGFGDRETVCAEAGPVEAPREQDQRTHRRVQLDGPDAVDRVEIDVRFHVDAAGRGSIYCCL